MWLALLMQAADLQKACAISRDDPSSDLAPSQADFQERVHSLATQLMQVTAPVHMLSTCICTKPCNPGTEGEPITTSFADHLMECVECMSLTLYHVCTGVSAACACSTAADLTDYTAAWFQIIEPTLDPNPTPSPMQQPNATTPPPPFSPMELACAHKSGARPHCHSYVVSVGL